MIFVKISSKSAEKKSAIAETSCWMSPKIFSVFYRRGIAFVQEHYNIDRHISNSAFNGYIVIVAIVLNNEIYSLFQI